MDEIRRLRVFLCHSSNDKPVVRILYKRLLLEQWVDPWLDEVTLKPGQDWQLEIEKAVDQTDVVIVCLSQNSITGDLQREVIFSEHYVTPLSISMLDLDNFKEINDTYGHIIGDEVLKDLTTILHQAIRYPDTIGRYGGDEFLLVFPIAP